MYNKVKIDGFKAHIPDSILTSEAVEDMLRPAYDKLNLSKGRLEMFTGIKERRYWPLEKRPSQVSAEAAEKLISDLGVDKSEIDIVIHCSVCRDFLEPATASVVHNLLNLQPHALNFDISNACLGVITGMKVIADMIEAGTIRRGLLVSGEIGFPLLKQTIDHLNSQEHLRRQDFKPHFASLTIGSCAAAVMLSHEDLADKEKSHKLLAINSYSNTKQNDLCQGGHNNSSSNGPLMQTDSEALLVAGVDTATKAWPAFLEETQWKVEDFDRCCTHQVGSAHTRLLFESLGLNTDLDFQTFDKLGNCGSASLPATTALAAEAGHLQKGHKIALLGIGSGINCSLCAIEW
ncbi:3-oxoacyl-(acyl carrier protein) synthase [Lentisphaera araneosa HTCC2155]|uniref:3-oxoacyl-(Acyl carrier protein) synthase n=1 Tax=Lentisphaera araneosa HTCC2155 TaxID=313628 RepID=A6DTW9_9BACT|nr:3-oxoacyl-ACP synthase III [Lentisphaera araneosa]EDM24938.1 3-oxoacyl-(acyl carrier protein) synthase [Lentisphaera araneosa HTCC2155]